MLEPCCSTATNNLRIWRMCIKLMRLIGQDMQYASSGLHLQRSSHLALIPSVAIATALTVGSLQSAIGNGIGGSGLILDGSG